MTKTEEIAVLKEQLAQKAPTSISSCNFEQKVEIGKAAETLAEAMLAQSRSLGMLAETLQLQKVHMGPMVEIN